MIGVFSGAALIFFAYTGFARVTLMAEEVKDPKRNIPRSIYLSLGISTVIYLLVSIVAIGLAGARACRIRFSPCRCDRYDRESRGGPCDRTGSNDCNGKRAADDHPRDLPDRFFHGPGPVPSPLVRQGPPALPYTPLCHRDHPRLYIAALLLADLTLVISVSTFAMLVFYLSQTLPHSGCHGSTAGIRHGSRRREH